MRIKLRKYLYQIITVRGTVNAIGVNKSNSNEKFLLLNNITHHPYNTHLCDHIWIKIDKNFFKLEKCFKRGDIIQFNSKVDQFLKKEKILEYGLFHVHKIKVVGRNHRMVEEILIEETKI